jgi:O-antigen ligase
MRSRPQVARYAAFFWGLVVFMPVGMNYLAFFSLLLCFVAQEGRAERFGRLRAHPMWWPMVFYVGWTVLVLLVGRTYPETPSNAWHGLRIVLTIGVALALSREEAIWGLRGFLVATAVNLALVVADQWVALPRWPMWVHSIEVLGNKSIANAVMFTLVAVSVAIWASEHRARAGLAGLLLAAILLMVPIWVLPSRTSLVVAVLVVGMVAVHRWRAHPVKLVVSVVSVVLVSTLVLTGIPKVQQRFEQGISEIQNATTGVVTADSWSVRFNMYRHTGAMMLERPVAGWGIGSWNEQWRQRVPPVLADFNMPHNDFLWMGAQAGIPGALALLWMLVAGMRVPWRRQDMTGRLALAAVLTLLLTSAFNSGMRDAALGLCLIWVTGLYLRMASESGDIVATVLGPRLGVASVGAPDARARAG